MKKKSLYLGLTSLLLSGMFLSSCDKDDDNNGMNSIPRISQLFASNNSDGNIAIYDVTDINNISSTVLNTPGSAADGAFYDMSNDTYVQASRSENRIESFTGIENSSNGNSLSIAASSSADMSSPRELAVFQNLYVVADNADVDGDSNTKDGRFYVYQKGANGFTLRNTITVNFKVWGIIFVGNDLYAVVDTDNKLAVFSDFTNNTMDMTLNPSKTVSIDGLVRTHGLTYDMASNTMILTDIGEASNPTDDGGIHVIKNFGSVFQSTANNGSIGAANQIKISGSNTMLGNPVDVAYDGATKTIYIAEAGNGGGKVLIFNFNDMGGNLSPVKSMDLPKASSVFLSK